MSCPVSEPPTYLTMVQRPATGNWSSVGLFYDETDAIMWGEAQVNSEGYGDPFFVIELRYSLAWAMHQAGLSGEEAQRYLAAPFTRTIGPFRMEHGERKAA